MFVLLLSFYIIRTFKKNTFFVLQKLIEFFNWVVLQITDKTITVALLFSHELDSLKCVIKYIAIFTEFCKRIPRVISKPCILPLNIFLKTQR